MKLDDTVCRGSLVIHQGVTYVVLNTGVYVKRAVNGKAYGRGARWKITATPNEKWAISGGHYIDDTVNVDTFFPGEVYPVPDYII
jgi:hypothetical protein